MRRNRATTLVEVLRPLCVVALALCLAGLGFSHQQPVDAQFFEAKADVGKVKIPGSAAFDPAKKEWRLTASGDNIWGTADAFYFAWKKLSGDLSMTADISFIGKGKNAHRKAGWMVRESLDADSPYAGVSVHGDGLVTLHYRKTKGGPTLDVKAVGKAPAIVKLERHADVFSVSMGKSGETLQPVGAVSVKLPDPVYVGLFACSHEADVIETAVISGVSLQNTVPAAGQKRVQETSLEVLSIDTGERKLIYRAREKFEAPNLSRDGRLFVINRSGLICTLPVTGGIPLKLDTGDAVQCNNDHGFSPDGKWLAISHSVKGQSQISIVPSTGGAPRRVTTNAQHSYWHAWSPDGKTLVYTAQRGKDYNIYAIPVEGGEEKALTANTGTTDGPDFTYDGKWIYFNSDKTGSMKLWRMKPDGSSQEQITKDADYGDWFPHPSPDGKWLAFMSFDKSVKGHPANQDVVLRIMPLEGGKARVLATLYGGQGTINVPSWSPDSKRIAFVSYVHVLP